MGKQKGLASIWAGVKHPKVWFSYFVLFFALQFKFILYILWAIMDFFLYVFPLKSSSTGFKIISPYNLFIGLNPLY